MINRRELLGLAAAAAASSGAAPTPTRLRRKVHATRAGEMQALRTFAEATHPRGREARDDPEWKQHWARLEASADHLPDGAYFVEARRALAWFEDGHTTVLPFEYLGKMPDAFAAGVFGLHLPWKLKVFDDGVHVAAATQPHADALGAPVERIGRLAVPELMHALDATWPGNCAWSQNWAGLALASPAQLQGLGALSAAQAPLPVTVAGREISLQAARTPPTLTDVTRTKSPRETWADAIGRGNYVKMLPDRRALYLSIDEMDDVDGATFEQLTREAFEAMESPAAERLIIDLRRNGGGNNFLGEPLRKHIERSRFNAPGRLFVMTGPATFSAAQNLANRLERETFATFVGGPTGLSPNHYGDAKNFTGPATDLTALVSTLPWFDSYPQDKREWIMPDALVPTTFADWQAGRDPALDAALGDKVIGLPDDLSRDRVFYYRRASQKQEWKTFWA